MNHSMVDITPHIGGVLCACGHCRSGKGSVVQVAARLPLEVVAVSADAPSADRRIHPIFTYRLERYRTSDGNILYEYRRTR
jgi:hypothetical protein